MKQLLCYFSILCVLACSKSGGDTEKPTITLNSPTANQQFSAGQVVTIAGTVTDNDEIHAVHIMVTDKTHSAEVKHFESHIDGSTYNFNQTFTVHAGTTYEVHVEADDHVGNISVVEVNVRGN